MSRRAATALVTLAALLASAAPSALADGDPASDVLLLRDVYLPYAPAPSAALGRSLERMLAELRRDGYPFKVALIETRGDLGAYPQLFGRAAPYAKLLASEIVFKVKHPRLLVVMQGAPLAGRNVGARGDAILARIRADPAARSDGLVRAAIAAVGKLAAAAGHPVSVPSGAQAKSGHGSSHTALYVVAAIVVLAGAGLIAVSRRRP